MSSVQYTSNRRKAVVTGYTVENIGDVYNIDIVSGGIVRGSVHSYESIQIEPNTVIGGALYSEETIKILAPTTENEIGAIIIGDIVTQKFIIQGNNKLIKHPIVIFGNVLANDVIITGCTVIRGNLFVLDNISVSAPTFVFGRVKLGNERSSIKTADIENMGFFSLYSYGNISLGHNVSTGEPIIVSEKGKIKLKSNDIRVLGIQCISCKKTNDPFMCPLFYEGKCKEYDILTKYDIIHRRNWDFLAWYWRVGPEVLLHHYIIHKLYENSIRRPPYSAIISKEKIDGVFFEKYYTQIVQDILSFDVESLTQEKLKEWVYELYEKSKSKTGLIKCPHCGKYTFKNRPYCMHCGAGLEIKTKVAAISGKTTPAPKLSKEKISSELHITARYISGETTEGTYYTAPSIINASKVPPDAIVGVPKGVKLPLKILTKVKGVIAKENKQTAYVLVAKRKNIPCFINVDIEKIPEGSKIKLQKETSEIIVFPT